jgi:hypothetical protein
MNIWEVVCVSDLIKILKESMLQFVIVGIVLESTPKSIQTEIKRFLKEKAKIFPNMKFLFFRANTKDLGKISLLDKDESQYPYVYHVFDMSNIFIKVNNANKQTIYEAFKVGEQYYIDNLKKYITEKEQENNDDTQDNISVVKQVKQVSQKSSAETNQISQKSSQQSSQHTSNHTSNLQNEEWAKQQLELESQQKNIEKTITLQQRAKDFNLELLKDIQQRKVEESKIKKKL